MKTLIALVLASSLAGCMSGKMSPGGMHGMKGMQGMSGMQGMPGMQGMSGMQGKEGTAGLFGGQARSAGGGMCGGQGGQAGGGMCGGGQGAQASGGMCGGGSQGMQGMMQQRADAMDADLDGMLSRDEFMKAQLAIFDSLPKNAQGLVEAKQMLAQMSVQMSGQMSGCPMMMGSMRH